MLLPDFARRGKILQSICDPLNRSFPVETDWREGRAGSTTRAVSSLSPTSAACNTVPVSAIKLPWKYVDLSSKGVVQDEALERQRNPQV